MVFDLLFANLEPLRLSLTVDFPIKKIITITVKLLQIKVLIKSFM